MSPLSGSPHVRTPVRLRAAAASSPPGSRGPGGLARASGGGGPPSAGGVSLSPDAPAGAGLHRGPVQHGARKNSWQWAEVQGEANPYGFQPLLGRAAWSPEAVRDALLAYVVDHLAEVAGVGIIDETGFLKKGTHSAGVARQYSGTAGRIENCQIGVFLAYAGARGTVLVDRELYLSTAWTRDPARLQAVGRAPDTPLATKPERARRMRERALEAGLPLAWVTGDSVYGHAPDLRRALEDRGQAYVLAVPRHEKVWWGWRQPAVSALHAALAEADWPRRRAGPGRKGERGYEWQWLRTEMEVAGNEDPPAPRVRSRLFRRSCTDPDDGTAYRVHAPRGTELDTVVRGAGTRGCLESGFEAAKQEVGLDEYEVRSATGGYRHMTLALWALARLAGLRAGTLPTVPPVKKKPTGSLAAFKQSRGLVSA